MNAPENEGPGLQIGGLTLMPGERVGPYIYERIVGRGGMATVILARDPGDQKIALKILKASRFRTGLARFRREFHALSRIKHPNVIGVDSYGDLHGHPYIVMEYVEGIDLHQTIRNFKYMESPDERWRRCEDLLIDICRALAHVHQRGLVHRDLKPSNILIDPQGHAKLTDFGIVKDLDPSSDANLSQTLVGTWAYASPEQISGEPIDQRSDLYSLGIILFAMLTGCRPFDEKDMKGYLEAHRNKKPPRPREYNRSIPKHLDEICRKLLEKDPRDRFQSAREILYRLEQAEAETGATPEEGLTIPLVGRGVEVETLQHAVDRLTRGEGGMAVIEGREGAGCSRLLRVVSDRAAGLGIPVHRLDASSGPAELFGLLAFCRQVIQALGERAPDTLVRAAADWAAGSGRGGDAIHRLMDRLRPALVQLLSDGPRILLYDDFHQVPPRGLELVRTLIRTTVEVGEPVLAVFAAHTESLTPATESLLRGEDMGLSPTRLRLEDLSLPAVSRLTDQLLGPGARSSALARRLHDETQGNPLFIAQFLASLLQQGILVENGEGLELSADTEEIATGHLEIPAGVRQVVRGRLGTLNAEEREVLEVLSVAGESLNLDLTLEVLDKDEEEVLGLLDRLIRRGIVLERRSGDLVHHEVTHRLMADVVYRELDTERRSMLHRKLAEQLERMFATQPAAVEQIGDHYRLAGEAGKAYSYLVQAARRMLARSLPGEAWDISVRAASLEDMAATRLPPGEVDPLRVTLQEVRGEVLFLRGAWQESLGAYAAMLRAADRAKDREAEVRARCRLATLYRRTDQPERAQLESNTALSLARTLPRRGVVAQALYTHAQLAWEDGDLATVERDANEGLLLTLTEQSRVRGDMLLALSAVQATQGRMAQASRGMEEAVEIFARLGEKPQRCIALCNLSQMLGWQGRLGEARARADEALALAHEIHYRIGLAFALTVRAEANLELNHLPQTQRDLDSALQEATALGLTSDLITIRFDLARLALRKHDPRRAENHLAIARGLAQRGDPEQYQAAITALAALCCAMTEDAADAWRMLEAAEKGIDRLPVPRRAQVLLAAAHAYATLGRTTDARRMAQSAASLCRPRGLRLMDLESRVVLAQLATDAEEAAAWTREARDLARAMDTELGPDLAQSFRSRAELAALPA